MTLLFFYIAIALGFSFLCSVLEAVLLSISPSFIAAGIQKKEKSAVRWQYYKENIDRSLAAILSLNTIAHTVGAAGAGAQATKVFGEVYFGIISAVLTLLILVVSEIIPKTLGALYWRQLAPVSSKLLRLVEWSMYPLVIMAQGITQLLSSGDKTHSVSREEIAALTNVGASEGALSDEESSVIQSMIRFHTLTARDIMTPRPVIFSLSAEATVAETVSTLSTLNFSRIPIYQDDSDNIIGFVRKDDILSAAVTGDSSEQLINFKRSVLSVPFSVPLLVLLRSITVSNHQVVLVVNEYGDILGLLTMEDLVETMLGLEIVDETDDYTDMQHFARELWRKRAGENGITLDESGEIRKDDELK
jgi:CBS domain containing-hemolysin-like protein